MEHTHDDGTSHDHAMDDAFQPTVEQLLQAAADEVANSRIELVQARAVIVQQNAIIEGLKKQLEGEA